MSVHPVESVPAATPRPVMNLPRLRDMASRGEKIAMLTAYDATFARVLDDAGVDTILVGDSLGNVIQGDTSTVPVALVDMVYHTRCTARGKRSAWLIADMPFGAYEEGEAQAFRNAARLIAETGAAAVKLEGGRTMAGRIRAIVLVAVLRVKCPVA